MDALILARTQFAANITFHILFPTLRPHPEVDGEIKGLNQFRGDHAPVFAVFWAFGAMVAWAR